MTFVQFLPSSRVTWIKPSSVPTQTVVACSGEGPMRVDHAEAVRHRLIDILGGDRIESGGHRRVHAAPGRG